MLDRRADTEVETDALTVGGWHVDANRAIISLFVCCHLENQVAFLGSVFSFLINDYLEGFCVCVRELGDTCFSKGKEQCFQAIQHQRGLNPQLDVKAGLQLLCWRRADVLEFLKHFSF